MTITRVGVVGAGLMGSGIAQVSAAGGYRTVVREVSRELLDRGLTKIAASLDRSVKRGKATVEQKEQTLKNLSGTTALEELGECELVIEAVTEDIAVKKEVFGALDAICKPEAIFATNTSSLTVTEMAVVTRRPEQFVGLHFFNPVPIMQLVEVVRTIQTNQATFDTVFKWAQSVGKVPIACKDNSGFVVNLLLVPYLLSAIRAVERGTASNFFLPQRTADRRIPFKTEQIECSRGLRQPAGVHLNSALGLSNEVGAPHYGYGDGS